MSLHCQYLPVPDGHDATSVFTTQAHPKTTLCLVLQAINPYYLGKFFKSGASADAAWHSIAKILILLAHWHVLKSLFMTWKLQWPVLSQAINPYYLGKFFKSGVSADAAWRSTASIFLCLTGAEASYADLGHFTKTSIRVSPLVPKRSSGRLQKLAIFVNGSLNIVGSALTASRMCLHAPWLGLMHRLPDLGRFTETSINKTSVPCCACCNVPAP